MKKEAKENLKKPEDSPSLRIIYNDGRLKLYQKRELRSLRKQIKELKSSHSKKVKESRKVKKGFKKNRFKTICQ